LNINNFSSNPGISVIIPTYNRELFLKETVQSVLDQNLGELLEIIISDDGSTDNTLAEAELFGNKIKIITKPKYCNKQGVAATRNRGILQSTKAYISFLDSDDFYLPGHLKKMVATLQEDPQLAFAFCRILEVKHEHGKNLFRPWSHKFVLKNDVINPVVSRSHIVHTNSFIFRREVFDHVGYFNESFSNGEDGDLWMRISEKYQGRFLTHFGVAYRTHHGVNQLTNNSSEQVLLCTKAVFENARKRYFELKLHDQRRIFKIEYYLLRFKYRNNNKTKYFQRYLRLIAYYPLGYFQKVLETCYEKMELNKGSWDVMDNYITGPETERGF
jgi:glycosyltransferase involved in cell wall biosynthesis